MQELYPGIQFGIGPAIENGFYYDVDPGETAIKEADLPAIEKKMAELAAKKEAVVRESISKTDALKMFGDHGETYKCELISELEDGHAELTSAADKINSPRSAFASLRQGGYTPLRR